MLCLEKKSEHYVNNKELLEAIIVYRLKFKSKRRIHLKVWGRNDLGR